MAGKAVRAFVYLCVDEASTPEQGCGCRTPHGGAKHQIPSQGDRFRARHIVRWIHSRDVFSCRRVHKIRAGDGGAGHQGPHSEMLEF
jgi:hypothetical protein